MNNNTMEIYKRLKKPLTTFGKVLLIIDAVSLVCLIAGAVTKIKPLMGVGLLGVATAMMTLIYFIIKAAWSGILKGCLKTLERTGNIQYINEIFNKEYSTDGSIAFSKHYIYVHGKTLIAYDDIVNIYPYNSDYFIVTIDGKKHQVEISRKTLKELLEHKNHIPYNAAYKEYRDKIKQFKLTHGI